MSKNKLAYFGATKTTPQRSGSTRASRTMASVARTPQPSTVNPDGFPAYKERGVWQEFARTVLANLIKNTYYKSADASAQEAYDVHLNAVSLDPITYLKGLVASRQANIKVQPQIGAAVFMSRVPATSWKNKVGESGNTTIESVLVELLATMPPNQLVAVAEMLRMKVFGKGLGTAAKRVFARAMATWSTKNTEYYAIKYRKELNQLLRMIHPPVNIIGQEKFKLLHAAIDGVGPVTERQKVAFDLIANPETIKMTDDQFGELLIKYDIDWEITKALKNIQSPRSWFARMLQMGTTALLLNLRSLDNHKVFEFPEGLKYLNEKMATADKARILPMEIVRAYRHVQAPYLKKALARAFASSFNYKMPEWEGLDVAFFLDISGSMSEEALTTAGSIAASLLPSLDNGKLLFATFNNRLYMEGTVESGWYGEVNFCPKITGEKPETVLERLFKLTANGGTNTSLGIEYLLRNRIHKDIIILATDEQQNTSSYYGKSMYDTFKDYQKKVNPNAMLYIVNCTNYEWHNAFQNDPSVITINTVTPTVLRNLPSIQKAEDIVNRVDLTKFVEDARARRANRHEKYEPTLLKDEE